MKNEEQSEEFGWIYSEIGYPPVRQPNQWQNATWQGSNNDRRVMNNGPYISQY